MNGHWIPHLVEYYPHHRLGHPLPRSIPVYGLVQRRVSGTLYRYPHVQRKRFEIDPNLFRPVDYTIHRYRYDNIVNSCLYQIVLPPRCECSVRNINQPLPQK